MNNTHKSRQQLINELQTLRAQIPVEEQTDADTQSLLKTVANISDSILSHTSLNDLLDALTHEIIATNLFRSLSITLIDNPTQNIQVVRRIHRGQQINRDILTLPLDTENIAGVVARTNHMEVIEGWDDRFAIDRNISKTAHIQAHENKISYFIPISQNKKVIAILATGSELQEKQQTLNRIKMLQPIIGQLAVAIRYAQLYQQAHQQTIQLEAQVQTQQQDIEEKDQSLNAFQKIDQTLLNTLDIDQLLDALLEHIHLSKYFRSLSISLVDHQKQIVYGVRDIRRINGRSKRINHPLSSYDLTDTTTILPLVVKTGQLQIVESPDDPRLGFPRQTAEQWKNKIAFFIPVKFENQTLAVLATGCQPDQKDIILNRIKLLKPFLNHMAIALKHAQLHQEAKEHNKKQEALLKVSRAVQNMLQSSDLENVFHTIFSLLQHAHIQFASFSIHHILDETTCKINTYRRLTSGEFRTLTTTNKEAVADWKKGKIIYRPNVEVDLKGLPENYAEELYKYQGIRLKSMLNMPFKQGVLVLRSEQNAAFSEHDIQFIEQIAETLSLGITRADDLAQKETQVQDLKNAEQTLLQNQNLLNQAQSLAHLGSWTLDLQTNQVHLSEELSKIYGLDTSESITTSDRIMEIIHPDDRQMIQDNTRKFAETGITEDKEFRIIRPNGDLAYLFGQAQVVTNSNGQTTGLIGTVQDITERKQMEAENQRSQRLRALGEMAAGLSHNLNNILTGILGPAQILQHTEQNPSNQEEIDAILNAGLRARDIVSRLSQSWHTETETLEATHIQAVIQEAIHASRPRWKDEPESRGINIDIHQHLEDLPPIRGTQTGLFDIIVNLIFNAVDAMPIGGHISFTTTKTQHNVRLLISDTGIGMSKEVLERAFDPFFTTKKVIGTGLGLSTVYGTISQWGGNIDVTSTPNQGTTFTLDFPVWEDNVITPINKEPQKTIHKSGRILLVDDEEIVARVLNRALSEHQVDVVSSSQKALDIFEPNKYDVLITDLGLPNLPGDQLAQQLCQQDPTLKTILISGWDLLPNDPRRSQFDYFIQKPFHDFEIFQQIITEVLKAKHS